MQEPQRIAQLYADWYTGNPWSCIRLTDILRDITPEMAAAHPIPGANSIWQLVQHCLGWRANVLRKLQGEVFESPQDNYLGPLTDTTPSAWQHLMEKLAANEQQWQAYLSSLTNETLNTAYAPSKGEFTVYQVIHGILHHDNYHFGQIVMLAKMVNRDPDNYRE